VEKTGRRGYHHGSLRAALIETALALIAERGPQGFSLAEASRRAGVSVSAPYRHFADRDELLAAVAAEAYGEVRRRLAAAVASAEDPAEQLARAAAAYVRFAAERRAMFSVLWEAGLDKRRHPALQRAAEETWETIARPARSLAPRMSDLAEAVATVAHGHAAMLADGQFGASSEAAEAAARRAAAAVRALVRGRRLLGRKGGDPSTGSTG
jgi:AcrR family transcriptional regulator